MENKTGNTPINYDTLLAVVIERGDTVRTKYGTGTVVDVVEWSDGIARHIEYYVKTNKANYKLTRGEIEKVSVG